MTAVAAVGVAPVVTPVLVPVTTRAVRLRRAWLRALIGMAPFGYVMDAGVVHVLLIELDGAPAPTTGTTKETTS